MSSANVTSTVDLSPPYAIYFGDTISPGYAKTGLGIAEWRKDLCLCQVERDGCTIKSGLPSMTIEEAANAGAKSLIIGIAPIGGKIPNEWITDIAKACKAGIDIVSGLHTKLTDIPELVEAAKESSAKLIDVRIPPTSIPIGSGKKRTGKRLLAVGTDCAVGKKYTALALEKGMLERGWNATFRATGQTGIMIAGKGIPIDSVVSDFIAGAAEAISPDAAEDHWDIIEGQGAIAHPAYAGVSLGLLHGSQPDALVLCHDASRNNIMGLEASDLYPLQSIEETMETHLTLARRVNPSARFVGITLNTSGIDKGKREELIADYAKRARLPAIDPLIDGVGPILDQIEKEFPV